MDNVNRIREGFIAPRISLDDSDGKKVDSFSLIGKKKLIIVFYRGGNADSGLSWLEELKESSGKIDLLNGTILVISIDEARLIRKLKQKVGLDFPLLYDKGSGAISAYGVLDTSSEKGEPHPATFVVDRLGIIRYRRVYSEFKDKPTIREIVSLLEGLT